MAACSATLQPHPTPHLRGEGSRECGMTPPSSRYTLNSQLLLLIGPVNAT